jgi:hypothetical protein
MSQILCIKNPLTAKAIAVDGPTYKKLVKQEYPVDNETQFPRFVCQKPQSRGDAPRESAMSTVVAAAQMKRAQSLSLEQELKRLTKGQKSKKLGLQTMIAMGSKPEQSRTYMAGWKAAAPQRGKQRQALQKRCGNKCFLRPVDLGYPICQKCDDDTCTCELDCRGLRAAYAYARKFDAHNIANAAREIAFNVGCEWMQ